MNIRVPHFFFVQPLSSQELNCVLKPKSVILMLLRSLRSFRRRLSVQL